MTATFTGVYTCVCVLCGNQPQDVSQFNMCDECNEKAKHYYDALFLMRFFLQPDNTYANSLKRNASDA